MKITLNDDKTLAYIESPYNAEFISKIKTIGAARWNPSKKAWQIPAEHTDLARSMMRQIYGECDLPENIKYVTVELHFDKECRSSSCAPISIFQREIARARGRDTGAIVGDDVIFTEGKPTSGGSRANYTTIIPAGSIATVYSIPETLLGSELPDGVTYKIIQDDKIQEHKSLIIEREKLLARLEEINKILGDDNSNEQSSNT